MSVFEIFFVVGLLTKNCQYFLLKKNVTYEGQTSYNEHRLQRRLIFLDMCYSHPQDHSYKRNIWSYRKDFGLFDQLFHYSNMVEHICRISKDCFVLFLLIGLFAFWLYFLLLKQFHQSICSCGL